MNIKLQRIQRILRDSKLLTFIERFRYLASLIKYNRKNSRFVSANPNFQLPPKILAYDAYSAPDWNFYKKSGEETAVFLAEIASKLMPVTTPFRVLEWGCGPARVIRHLNTAFYYQIEPYGSDYNEASINWCRTNIPNCNFVQNLLHPPLPFDTGFFDFIYSISVFTHLSDSISHQWSAELFRIARPGGVLIITTNGDSRINVMLPDELESYRTNGFVIRDKYEEGKKMFWACHSPRYAREVLFQAFSVIEHVEAAFPYTGQDFWILKKPL